ncbi:hypothetical protein K466DRAFT_586291 [Polyporus arcularius HHB13444]|uniref:Uncharacterized protein n=1 Tax=Polyporus arcularius HHB13444 TaxID=1314778 RepID=A0A5C3PCR2_9APHY|nr:hypothetical protein K466DRAFT_586291 [Polyporus arcularius HHB13444]
MAIKHPSLAPAERELTIHQRNLVDTNFEEGQYEAAIFVLDEITSRKCKPFPAHIRQLIYIALYPPLSIEDQLEEEAMKLEPGSPSKVLSRRHKSSLAPTPKAVASAQNLLKKLSRTNKPESLACAVPSYPDDPSLGLNNRTEEEDSYIAKQALRLQNARCCWEILKEGFIQRSGSDMMSSPRKPTSRRSTRGHYDGDDGWEDEDNDTPVPVGDHAWSVLDWLLALFEKDEAAVERAGQVRYSPLLLSQIPPSRAHNTPRWDVEMPLDVAFHALLQDGEAQRSLGVRLISLLINLTSTTLLDLNMFLNAVSTRVSSSSVDTLSYLFSSLPPTQTIAHFKVMLCRHALGGSHTMGGKPKPQARARAQPRRRTRTTTDAAVDASAGASTSADADAGANGALGASNQPSTPNTQDTGADGASSVARKYPAISTSDVLELFSRASKSDAASVALTLSLKAELLISYALVQQNLGPNDRDGAWQDMLHDGTLRRAVEDVFDLGRVSRSTDAQTRELIRTKKDALFLAMSMW